MNGMDIMSPPSMKLDVLRPSALPVPPPRVGARKAASRRYGVVVVLADAPRYRGPRKRAAGQSPVKRGTSGTGDGSKHEGEGWDARIGEPTDAGPQIQYTRG